MTHDDLIFMLYRDERTTIIHFNRIATSERASTWYRIATSERASSGIASRRASERARGIASRRASERAVVSHRDERASEQWYRIATSERASTWYRIATSERASTWYCIATSERGSTWYRDRASERALAIAMSERYYSHSREKRRIARSDGDERIFTLYHFLYRSRGSERSSSIEINGINQRMIIPL
jgi:hypothetical protein